MLRLGLATGPHGLDPLPAPRAGILRDSLPGRDREKALQMSYPPFSPAASFGPSRGRTESAMSFSWVFVASFEIPADQLAAFKKSHPARKTDEDAIVRDPQLNDCSYKKNRFECRWLFEKSQYADTVAEIDGLCGDVLAAGGTGEGSIVGYVDGPTDEGDRFRVAAGAVAHEALDATAAQTVTKSAAYKAVEKRMKQAFEP